MSSVTSAPRPDFFIVGAPKCGTTSLNAYLAAHPQIFMAPKEQHFFGSDLADIWPQPTSDRYFASFAGSENATRRGDAGVWYLRSRVAAEEIYTFNSSAQIIAIVRDPVEMLPSYHSQLLWREWETIQDFGQALAAESDRLKGRRIPRRNGGNPWRLLYRDVVRFYEQIDRYLSVFGRDQVCVLLFDDLVERPAQTYKSLLEFLGVDSSFSPDFAVLNSNKYNRSRLIRRALDVVCDPSPRVRRVSRRLVPVRAARSAMVGHVALPLRQVNTRVTPRPPVDEELRLRLNAEFAPDVRRLGALLGRDLTHWCAPSAERATNPSG